MNIPSLSDLIELTKLRLCCLALLMASLGYWVGSSDGISFLSFFIALFGISMVGASSGMLNQYLEREYDKQMPRTCQRPLPQGRVEPGWVLKVGLALAVAGEVVLVVFVNPLTAVLGAVTLLFYLGIYTPSKRITSLSTLLGAIPGALPPLMGYTASSGKLAEEGWLLFGVVFLWQIPHFLAIAWMYREDYARAGMRVLTVVDPGGTNTIEQVLAYTLVLLPFSLLPSALGVAGVRYFFGMVALGLLFLFCGVALAIYRTRPHARRLFFASILYLPIWGFLLVWDRIS